MILKQVGLKTKMIIGTMISVMLLTALGMTGIMSIRYLINSGQEVERFRQVNFQGMNIQRLVSDMLMSHREYLVSGQEEFLDLHLQYRERLLQEIRQMSHEPDIQAEQKERLKSFDYLILEWFEKVADQEISERKSVKTGAAMEAKLAELITQGKGNEIMGQIRSLLDKTVKTLAWAGHYRAQSAVMSVAMTISAMETGKQGFLTSGDQAFLELYAKSGESFDTELKNLREIVSYAFDQSLVKQSMEKLEPQVVQWQRAMRDMVKNIQDVPTDKKIQAVSVMPKAVDILNGQEMVFIMSAFFRSEYNAGHRMLNQIEAKMYSIENSLVQYSLTGDSAFISAYRKSDSALRTDMFRLKALINNFYDKEILTKDLDELEALIVLWMTQVVQPEITLKQNIKTDLTMEKLSYLITSGNATGIIKTLSQQLEEFFQAEAQTLIQKQEEASRTGTLGIRSVMAGLVVAILFILASSAILNHSITKPFREIFKGVKKLSVYEIDDLKTRFSGIMSDITAGANEAARTSHEIAEGASEQAAAIEQTSASLNEMSSLTKNIAENTEKADYMMKQVGSSVNLMRQSMDNLTVFMKDISQEGKETFQIINTIHAIAFQTNLLALNAAVESARAGEVGAGFSVVAAEVRNLALKTSKAASNTNELINNSVKKIQQAEEMVSKNQQDFSQIVKNVDSTSNLIADSRSATCDVARRIDHLNNASTDLGNVITANAAGAARLSEQTEMLKQIVNTLEPILEGKKQTSKLLENHSKKS